MKFKRAWLFLNSFLDFGLKVLRGQHLFFVSTIAGLIFLSIFA